MYDREMIRELEEQKEVKETISFCTLMISILVLCIIYLLLLLIAPSFTARIHDFLVRFF